MKHLALLAAFLLPACLPEDESTSTVGHEVNAPNAVTTWHANAQSLVAANGKGNAAQAYTSALIQIAVYDAAVAIRGGYEPFQSTVSAPAGADLNAAIATAAHRVGMARVTGSGAATVNARTNFDNAYNAYMAAIPEGQAKTDGIAVGEAAANAVIAARAGDNYNNTASYVQPPADIGVWQVTNPTNQYATAGANDYAMSFVTPITASSPDARRPPSPVNTKSYVYARDLAEVVQYGDKPNSVRTTEQNNTAQFWTESGFTLWSRNARAIATSKGLDEVESARFLAAFGVATGDGMLACFEAKYHYNFWRPFQGTLEAATDGNRWTHPDPNWVPAVRANHPEYPSGHSCYGGAAARAIEHVLGDGSYTLTSTGGQLAGWPAYTTSNPVTFNSLDEIVDHTGNARVWSGLHYRSTMNKTTRWVRGLADEALCGNFGIECNDHCDADAASED